MELDLHSVYDFMTFVGKILPSRAGQRGSISGGQTMSGMKDFSRERTIPCQSRELCRDPCGGQDQGLMRNWGYWNRGVTFARS
jgi:hypothetical protein